MEYSKYKNTEQQTPTGVPSNKRAVPPATVTLLRNRATAIVSQRARPIPGGLTIGGDASPRNIVISIDSEGTLQNPLDFSAEKTVTGIGKTKLARASTGVSCKRLNSKSKNQSCNCFDATDGTPVKGSEKYETVEESIPDFEPPRTTSLAPRYICRGTVSWEQYRHGFGWTAEKEDLTTTFFGPRVLTTISFGRTITEVCTVKYQKEKDCCL
jgi:hypothetical protein